MSTYNILSIDGGGVFVVMPLLFLRRIENKKPGFLASVDVFAGTSAGGIAALLIASENDPVLGLEKAIDFWEMVQPAPLRGRHHLEALLGVSSFALTDSLKPALSELLGTIRFSDLPKRVIVSSVQLDDGDPDPVLRSWEPRALSNLAVAQGRFADVPAIDIALRTSAAPIMSRVHQGYVDGGLFANDPSMLALTLLMNQIRFQHQTGIHSRNFLRDISLFSLSEGQKPHYILAGTEDWGYRQWLFSPNLPLALLELMLSSGGEEISEQCRLLLGDDQYFRLNPLIKPTVNRATHTPTLGRLLDHAASNPAAGMRHAQNPGRGALAQATSIGEQYDLTEALNWLDTSEWFTNVGGQPIFLTEPEQNHAPPRQPTRPRARSRSAPPEDPLTS